ncbi:MAG: DUF3500 domain-containing protein [Microbacterium sp.]
MKTNALPRYRRATLAAGAALLMALTGCASTTTPETSATSTTSGAATTSSSETATASESTAVATVVSAADAFLATLDDSQVSEVVLDLTNDNAAAWSNLPCGSDCRNGIQFSTLSDAQLTAAKAVLQAALNTSTGVGYDQAMQILLADDVLGSAGSGGGGGGGNYSSGTYFLAFLGEPSTDGTWMLQFGGHHLAVNVTYSDGAVEGGSPFFIGVEPTSWTDDDGTSYAPLDIMKDAVEAMITSLSSDELSQAKLSESFTDVLMGPDQDGAFPETKSGIAVSSLSDDQQQLVLAAMTPWVSIVDDQSAEDLLAVYESELDETYISYSGSTDLTSQGDYIRIDGPSVWIEFVCQNGVVYSDQIHYHTVYRDHTRDYGGELSF